MKRFSLLLLLTLLLVASGWAQDFSLVQCLDETTFSAQAAITLPEISEDAPSEYRITALRSDDVAPLVGVTTAEGDTFCNGGNDGATFYEFSTTETAFFASGLAAQEFAFDPGQNTVQIGAEDNAPGTYLVVIEGDFFPEDPRDHTYSINLAAPPANEDVALMMPQVLLFALNEETSPALQVMNAEGDAQEAQPTQAQLTTDIAFSERAVRSEVSEQAQVTVPYTEFGQYALVLIFSSGTAETDQLMATVSESEFGWLDLRCDESIFVENALEILLPDDGETYTVTALDANEDTPVLAAINADDTGSCETTTPEASTYAMTLPDLEIPASQSSAQITATDARRIVAGNQENFGADMALIIEGAVLEGDSDVYQVRITPGMLNAGAELEIYAIALTTQLDPVLSLDAETSAQFGEEAAIICDNAGESETCYGQSTLLNDYSVMLSGEELRGYELDASLRLPLFDLPDNTLLPITVSANEGTSGGYVLILHLVTQ